MEERVRGAFDRFNADGPEAIRELLDLYVEILAPQPGPWDCRGREAVLRFLGGYRAAGHVAQVIEVTDHGDRLLLGLRRTHPDRCSSDHYSVLIFNGTRLCQVRGFPSRATALIAAEGSRSSGYRLTSVQPRVSTATSAARWMVIAGADVTWVRRSTCRAAGTSGRWRAQTMGWSGTSGRRTIRRWSLTFTKT